MGVPRTGLTGVTGPHSARDRARAARTAQVVDTAQRQLATVRLEPLFGEAQRPPFEDAPIRSLALTSGLIGAISVELPNSVNREIIYTEPAVKGDTSGKVMKPAKIASGFEVQVPLFVSTGDKVEIDTRTGEYKRRV